jgi:hypothetical protein
MKCQVCPPLAEYWMSNERKPSLAEAVHMIGTIVLPANDCPVFNETDWRLQPMFVDTNPFLFRGKVCGAMVRLSSSPIVNVTSGGGETGFFVIEEAA